ncbi:MAG: cupredoxin domain-containing protein [Candidatus Tectomicrobia bacterium]|uniref:Cupredoxin domain-containing protein n=1 Tax=Tectimicrobiota bacterium TaxID=2528274 RepID=A0A932M1L6_UNCTE|nr:cupredoxin domain-containing protein [Candidatus Tectomicrobia bacterium]
MATLGFLAVLGLVGLSDKPVVGIASGDNVESNPTPGASVTIQTFQFRPALLEVKAGTRVTWTNQDDILHTITSGTPESPDSRFNGRLQGKGSTFSFTFTQAGTYSYFCTRHNSMRGQIRVN